MHERHKWDHAIFFSYETIINMRPYNCTYGKCFAFNTDWKDFEQYLIVGRYLGVALNDW